MNSIANPDGKMLAEGKPLFPKASLFEPQLEAYGFKCALEPKVQVAKAQMGTFESPVQRVFSLEKRQVDIPKTVLELNSIGEFNPMQRKALEAGIFGNNIVVSSPTASGKTLVAELAALHSIVNLRRKVIYTCPLRALASEHYNDFKRKYSKKLGIRATISTGDFDSSSKYLANYDVIFTTYEKLDSLIRHSADWLQSTGLLVIDEIHEIDSGRGPTLEIAITKMRMLNPGVRLLALSATIPNAKEIAEWLDAKLVESDFRPVKLIEGTYLNNRIRFGEKEEAVAHANSPIEALALDVLKTEKQVLFFANTRKRAEGIAKQLAPLTKQFLGAREAKHLKNASQKVLSVLESPTEQCKAIASLLEQGVCFHHAGLLGKQREIIEELFKNNCVKALSSTTTLAAGVNLPAYRIVIPSLYRYDAYGSVRIPVREYKQLCGRAGRPKYHDKQGEAVLIAKSEFEEDELHETYINGEIEDVTSKLSHEAVLRMHTLAAIANNFIFDLASMEQFFSKTFYAKQYGDLKELFEKLNEIISELRDMGFVETNAKRITATRLGARISELYLDPLSAHAMISALKTSQRSALAYLYMVSNTSEFAPWLSVPKNKEPELGELLQSSQPELPVDVQREQFTDMHLLNKFAASLMLEDWISETGEETIIKKYGTMPGSLHAKLQIADWLSYALFELARILQIEERMPELAKLRKRLKHGVKDELLALVEVRGIGRVRGRKLWNSNIRTIAELKRIDVQDLAKILGIAVAESIKKQLRA